MKLVSYFYKNQAGIGAVIGDEIIESAGSVDIPDDMIEFLAAGQDALDELQHLIESGRNRIPIDAVTLRAPIPKPGKFLGVGLNYQDHIDETEREKPEYPTFFTKQSTCVIGHNQFIQRPVVSDKLDYEGELAMVIGKRCKHVPLENAAEVIAGYTIVNDVSVRDWQIRSPTWTLGKSFDTHGPMGPYLVTSNAIGNPHDLDIKTWVDDDLRQSSNTRFMIFNCYEIIAYLTQAMTLEPGDVISTGTPAGVGVKMRPRGYLKPDQTVRISIEKIGILSNSVVQEVPTRLF
jgi:2-keto-4-pentenoate hydratase/2-oxohepta-3-ene-1,7-dioic acid hydratase in catechol pathway